MKKLLWVTLVAVLAVGLAASTVLAATLNVGPGQTYTTIQAAIAAANPLGGDTILVYPGDYNPPAGGYVVGIPVIIKSQKGAAVTKIITSGANDYGFIIPVGNVTISGFTVKKFGVEPNLLISGILVGGTAWFTPVGAALNGVVITKCLVEYFSVGILVLKANGTDINNNTVRYNTSYGVLLYSRDFAPPNPEFSDYDILNTEISHNQIYENQYYGIGIFQADGFVASFDGTVVTTNTFYRNGSQDYTAPANWNNMGITIGSSKITGTVTVTNNKFLKLSDEVAYGYIRNGAGVGLTLIKSGNKAFKKLKGSLSGGATAID